MKKNISFIGLGNMGMHMASNLVKNGFNVFGFDIDENTYKFANNQGIITSNNMKDTIRNNDIIITMLPEGTHVEKVWHEIIKFSKPETLIVDCSTIDINTSKKMHKLAKNIRAYSLDAPVSGGTVGAKEGTLTFMVGGEEEHYKKMLTLFDIMGKKSILCGPEGSGQAVKICNNLVLAISMIGTGEIINLAEKLKLDKNVLFNVISTSTGSCWAINNYFPVKNIGPISPADNDFKPGFSAKLMLKDLSLASEAIKENKLKSPMGMLAKEIYRKMVDNSDGNLDFSAIFKSLNN